MQVFDRRDFVQESQKRRAHLDQPLPIGFGQTISQPSTVARMLSWLDPSQNDRTLDIGSGSGWTSAILSQLAGPNGKVDAVERIPELVEFGRSNCSKYNLQNVEFFQAGDTYGLPDRAPYDRILVSASAHELPTELLGQLKIGGKLVIPVVNDILEITKTSPGSHDTRTHHGYMFVPLI